jgi:tRNA-specific 2-thiouridylase
LARETLSISGTNWLGGEPGAPSVPVAADAKIRSTTAPKPAKFLRTAADTAQVTLAEPEYGVAAGQACVLYRGTRVLGGGWIAREN